MMVRYILALVGASAYLLSGAAAHAQVAAVAAPAVAPAVAPAPTPTLWSFLGVPQGFKKVRGAVTNRRGNRPGLEPQPALKALNDPLNFFSPNPAIRTAAEVKLEEDLAPQKIKAIKYLASIGCGCYDKGGEVTAALIAATEDCTEEVRLATMEVIYESAANKCCGNCGQVCCCNEALVKRLADVAYLRDDSGCYIEPSARVREAAARALTACCPNPEPPVIVPEEPAAPDVTPVPPPPAVPLPERTDDAERPLPERSREDLEDAVEDLEDADRLEEALPDRIESDPRPTASSKTSEPSVLTLGATVAEPARPQSSGVAINLSDRRVRAESVGFQSTVPATASSTRVVPPATDYPKVETRPTVDLSRPAVSSYAAPGVEVGTGLASAQPPVPSIDGLEPSIARGVSFQPAAPAELAATRPTAATKGVVYSYNVRTRTAGVTFADPASKPSVGQLVSVRGVVGGKLVERGSWRVVAVEPTCVRIEAVDSAARLDLIPGDRVFTAE